MSRGGFTESNLARCATPSCVTITKLLPSGVNAKHLAAGNVQRTLVSDCCELFDSVFSYSITPQLIIQITHTHPFKGPLSGTTQVSQYQKGKTNLDFIEQRDTEWQWHQLGHMQICTSLQTDNHTSIPPLSFYRPDALPAAQPTASKH